MRTLLQLAAALALFSSTGMHAQVYSPDNLIAPPPRNPAHRERPIVTLDLQWMWPYTKPAPKGDEAGLLADPRFARLLHETLIAPQAFWRNGTVPLDQVAQQYFGVQFGNVQAEGNRTITLTGCVPHNCADQGLLWLDTAAPHPSLIFVATEWTAVGKTYGDPNADYNLWIFPSGAFDVEHPPAAFVHALRNWNTAAPQHIQTAIVVMPDGTPHPASPVLLGMTPSVDHPQTSSR